MHILAARPIERARASKVFRNWTFFLDHQNYCFDRQCARTNERYYGWQSAHMRTRTYVRMYIRTHEDIVTMQTAN